MPSLFEGDRTKSDQFLRELNILMLANRGHPALTMPLDRIGIAISYIRGPKVDDWVEYMLNKIKRALAQGVQPQHEALWEMFIRDFRTSYTDTTKMQSAHQELLNLQMKPGALDDYVSAFEHCHQKAEWGTDDAGTIMLFKKGLTKGLHCTVLEKTYPHPTTLRGWIEAARHQYELWAEIKASMGGDFGRPQISADEVSRWSTTLGTKRHPWQGTRRKERMDLDVVEVNALTTDEKTKLQKEGRCFLCKRLGHISRVCPNKKNGNAPHPPQNISTTARVTEIETEKVEIAPKEAMVNQIKAMSAEQRNQLLDDLVLQGF
jgi:hypothetical protein